MDTCTRPDPSTPKLHCSKYHSDPVPAPAVKDPEKTALLRTSTFSKPIDRVTVEPAPSSASTHGGYQNSKLDHLAHVFSVPLIPSHQHRRRGPDSRELDGVIASRASQLPRPGLCIPAQLPASGHPYIGLDTQACTMDDKQCRSRPAHGPRQSAQPYCLPVRSLCAVGPTAQYWQARYVQTCRGGGLSPLAIVCRGKEASASV